MFAAKHNGGAVSNGAPQNTHFLCVRPVYQWPVLGACYHHQPCRVAKAYVHGSRLPHTCCSSPRAAHETVRRKARINRPGALVRAISESAFGLSVSMTCMAARAGPRCANAKPKREQTFKPHTHHPRSLRRPCVPWLPRARSLKDVHAHPSPQRSHQHGRLCGVSHPLHPSTPFPTFHPLFTPSNRATTPSSSSFERRQTNCVFALASLSLSSLASRKRDAKHSNTPRPYKTHQKSPPPPPAAAYPAFGPSHARDHHFAPPHTSTLQLVLNPQHHLLILNHHQHLTYGHPPPHRFSGHPPWRLRHHSS